VLLQWFVQVPLPAVASAPGVRLELWAAGLIASGRSGET